MSPTARRIALTGIPRSGTTLCCRLLGQAGNAVALFEPMPVHELPAGDPAPALDAIEAFFAACRHSILVDRRAPSQQVGGTVPDNPFVSSRDAQGARVRESVLGEIGIDKPLGGDFTLVIKHNAAFTALLPGLAQRISTVAVVRNPLAALASWNSVSLPVSRGRLPAGERLDPALAERLAGLADLADRQLAILDWFFARFAAHRPSVRVVRYEEVTATAGRALAEASGLDIPSSAMSTRNASTLYDGTPALALARRLLDGEGAWRAFYGEDEVMALARKLSAGTGRS